MAAGKNGKRRRMGRMETMALSKTTQDHDEIRAWAEARGGKPAEVASTSQDGTGILRIEFPGATHSNDSTLEEIPWEQFFEKFDASGLSLVYQDVTAEGAQSNFNRLVYPENLSTSAKKGLRKSPGMKTASTRGAAATKKSGAKAISRKAAEAKPAARKAAATKTASKTAATKKAASKTGSKATAKKTPAKKAAARTTTPTKGANTKTSAKKASAKTPAARRNAAKKAAPTTAARKGAATKKTAAKKTRAGAQRAAVAVKKKTGAAKKTGRR